MSPHLTIADVQRLIQLQQRADEQCDGHLTILKFTTDWRIGFITPEIRCHVCHLFEGKTFAEAATLALTTVKESLYPKQCQIVDCKRIQR